MAEPPTVENLINVLQKCRQKKNLAYAKRLHAYMCEHELESHPVLGNYLVSMLVDCGILSAAQQVFDRLAHRSKYSWSSLIAGYVDCGESQHAFHLYQKMQDEYVQPKSFTYRALLKGCAGLKDPERGRELHAVIVREGLERDPFIGSVLVDMYGKCGLLVEARQVFDKLPVRDVVSWTVLIAGCAELGFVEEVQKCLKNMQLEGVSPDASTFVCSLKACGIRRALETGREIHCEIVIRGLEQELYVGHTLVDMYAKCGSLVEAQELFDQLPVRSVVPWTALISGYAENGLGEEALNCLEQMRQEGVSPVAVTFVCSLKACGIAGAFEAGREIHLELTKRGLEIELYVGTTLVDMYAKCGSLSEAQEVLSRLPVRGAAAWNALIAGWADYGLGEEALNCLKQMQQEGISPVVVTFSCSLKACGIRGALETGREIHAEIIKQGLERDLEVGNTLVDMYVKCSSVAEARELFDQLPVQNVVPRTVLIAGYAENGLGDEVLNSLEQMQLEGVSLDAITCVCSLKACGMVGAFVTGQKMHAEVTKRGLERELNVGTTLMDMYAKCGLFAEAREVFDRLPVRGAASWNTLIAGYADHGFGEKALNCFKQMQLEGLSPVTATFAGSLKACGSMRALEIGREIHTQVIKRGLEREVDVGNTLVDMYARCGLLAEGHKSLGQLLVKNAVPWTSLIAGYAENGLGDVAVNNIEQMMLEGASPSANTFVFSLKACGMVGAFGTGQKMHAEVTKRGLEREVYVGTTLVDMYAKCGSLAEARDVLDRLPVRGAVTWNALIAGYADHGFSEEALDCFTKMQLEGVSPVAVTYACSLKSCGMVGALETGWEMHAEITKRGLERDPFVGSAMVDMYAKCGSLAEAQEAFDKLPVHDVATWNAMIKANGENHEGNMAVQCFEDMQEQGVKPDAITFTCLLAACSHASLVLKGQEYFKVMVEHGIKPTLDHYTCMVDLLARSGHVYEAERFAKVRQCLHSEEILRALLSACKIHGEVELGLRCFQRLVQLNQEDAAAYLLMADIYASAGRWSDASRIEETRIHAEAKKMPARALIEVNKKLHEFVVGDEQSKDVAAVLEILSSHMKNEGYMPNVDLVLGCKPAREMVAGSYGFVSR